MKYFDYDIELNDDGYWHISKDNIYLAKEVFLKEAEKFIRKHREKQSIP